MKGRPPSDWSDEKELCPEIKLPTGPSSAVSHDPGLLVEFGTALNDQKGLHRRLLLLLKIEWNSFTFLS